MAMPPYSNNRRADEGEKNMRQKSTQFADDNIKGFFLLGYIKGVQDTCRFVISEDRLNNTREQLIPVIQSVGVDRTYHSFSTDSSGDIMEMMRRIFIEKLTEISEIEYIYSVQDDEIVRVWSIINRHNKAIKKRIYDQEYDILDRLPIISFDFHVLVREDRPVNEMAPTGAELVFQRN
jgi:hypothetical protein